jgi:hypothetical protein
MPQPHSQTSLLTPPRRRETQKRALILLANSILKILNFLLFPKTVADP